MWNDVLMNHDEMEEGSMPYALLDNKVGLHLAQCTVNKRAITQAVQVAGAS